MIHLARDRLASVAGMDDGQRRVNRGWLDAVTSVPDEVGTAPP